MKTNSIALLIILLFVPYHSLKCQNRITIETQPFHELIISGRIDVELIPSGSTEMSITSRNGQPEEVQVTFSGKELKIKVPTRIKKDDHISVRVPYTRLTRIRALAGAKVNSARDLRTENLELEVGTGGKIELSIKAEHLVATVAQVSDIILYGEVISQEVSVNTGGNYLAYDLKCRDTSIKVSAGSQGKVNATASIDATATAKGFIGYTGNPANVQIKTVLGGEITPFESRPENDDY